MRSHDESLSQRFRNVEMLANGSHINLISKTQRCLWTVSYVGNPSISDILEVGQVQGQPPSEILDATGHS